MIRNSDYGAIAVLKSGVAVRSFIVSRVAWIFSVAVGIGAPGILVAVEVGVITMPGVVVILVGILLQISSLGWIIPMIEASDEKAARTCCSIGMAWVQ